VGDVSVIHPGSSTFRRSAAQRPGVAAASRDAANNAKYRRREGASCTFVPMLIESYGRRGAPQMDLIQRIGCEAAECSEFNFSSTRFVSGVLRRLSVCLCKWNHQLDRVCASCSVRTSGCRFQGFQRFQGLSVHSLRLVTRSARVVYSCLFCFLGCYRFWLCCLRARCVMLVLLSSLK
jgi:hypothetical protein